MGVAPDAGGPVGGHAGHAHLHAHVAKALVDEAARLVDGLLNFGAGGMRVAGGGFAALAAQKLVNRHIRLAALDIPEGLVHAADGVVQHRTVAPVGAVVAGLPNVFDLVGALAGEEGAEILLDRRIHQFGALREGRAAVAVEAVLVGGDLDHGEAQAGGGGGDYGNIFDDGSRQAPRSALGLVGKQRDRRGGGQAGEEIAAIHGSRAICGPCNPACRAGL